MTRLDTNATSAKPTPAPAAHNGGPKSPETALKSFFASAFCIHAVIGLRNKFELVPVQSIDDAARKNVEAQERGHGHSLCGLLGFNGLGELMLRCDPQGQTTMIYAAHEFGRRFPAPHMLASEVGRSLAGAFDA